MRWIHPLAPDVEAPADVLGGKAHGLVVLQRLGLPVPAGFVIGTAACREFLRRGGPPTGLREELAAAVADLEARTGRELGGSERPLVVSVRSGAGVSMPGMLTTILDVGLTTATTAVLAAGTGDARFALDSRERLRSGFAAATGHPDAPVPENAAEQLERAVAAVFTSWDGPRARTYRELHEIPHDLGTAVTVQRMVFGNRDDRSGSGVAFTRDPGTGEPVPSGDVLFGRQGDDVVSGGCATRPLHELAEREPGVWAGLGRALARVEEHYRDACCLEFTFEAGELWLLQVRPARFVGAAAVRVATDLADEGVIGRHDALLRVSPHHLRHARTPRLAVDPIEVLARGVGAGPGVAVGRVATTADAAVRMAADGPVILVRPETSPLDVHGIAAAAGILTALGGPASHAAVVARALGRPAVVGVGDLTVDVAGAVVRAGGRSIGEGTVIAIDGTGGEVVLGSPRIVTAAAGPHLQRLLGWADEAAGGHPRGTEEERLGAARAAILRGGGTAPSGSAPAEPGPGEPGDGHAMR